MQIKEIRRLRKDTYELVPKAGPAVQVIVNDSELITLARLLGFGQFYDLEDHLELTTEVWEGTILLWGGDDHLPGADDPPSGERDGASRSRRAV